MSQLFLSAFFADVSHHFQTVMQDTLGETLAGKSVAFIPTAADVEEVTFFMDDDRKAFERLGIRVDELDLATMPLAILSQKIADNDFIFVGGGNTYYLLQRLNETGLGKVITHAVQQGKLYIGTSAGSVIVSPDIGYIEPMEDVSLAPNLASTQALHLSELAVLPHYRNEPFMEVSEQIYQAYKDKIALVPLSNHQALFVNHDTHCILE